MSPCSELETTPLLIRVRDVRDRVAGVNVDTTSDATTSWSLSADMTTGEWVFTRDLEVGLRSLRVVPAGRRADQFHQRRYSRFAHPVLWFFPTENTPVLGVVQHGHQGQEP